MTAVGIPPALAPASRQTTLRRLASDSLYVLTSLPLALANFVVGASNQLAYTAAMAMVSSTRSRAVPLPLTEISGRSPPRGSSVCAPFCRRR